MFSRCNMGVTAVKEMLVADYTANAHKQVLWVETFNTREFVAILEAKQVPIYAVQFHPEKLIFTNAPNRIAQYDTDFAQYFSRFFVNESLKTGNVFEYDTLRTLDFGNYCTRESILPPGPAFWFVPDYYFPNGGACSPPDTCTFTCLQD